MPWSERSVVRERVRFVSEVEAGIFSISELCERYGISRKTGYKWIWRYEEEGPLGLEDRRRIAHHCPHRTEERIVKRLVEYRREHPSWGPRKLLECLKRLEPEAAWPSASTAGDWLRRRGLVEPRRRARRLFGSEGGGLTRPERANEVWSADFKGQFKTGDGQYCYPLTVADGASRFLLEVQGLESTRSFPVRRRFEGLFRKYGLPHAIRTDNGSPFASVGLARLSRLSVWWTRLGIVHQRITPAHPQQNGSHERMHRTLKAETARPPQRNLRAQQRRFDAFCREYNDQRPHEALGMKTPASLYVSSSRPYPARLPQLEYPGHFQIRRVGSHGTISVGGKFVFLSETLSGELVALEEVDDGIFSLFLGPLLLARLDQRSGRLHQGLPR